MAVPRNDPPWAELSNEALLEVRFCDLKLRLNETPLARRIARLHAELSRRGLSFRPHFWLAEEWFSPDAVPGVAIPFYLAHPRLRKLEYHEMHEVEGGTERTCMQLLRHETGHAIDTAYRLHRRPSWRRTFGSSERPYPNSYTPRPHSRSYVLHLDWWYAQSHPSEDFAETFAVWLGPRSKWRRDYAAEPALKKLCTVDAMMHSIAGKTAPFRCRRHVEPLSRNTRTLREHYAEKRSYYRTDAPAFYDIDLLRLFTQRPRGRRRRRTAAGFLRRVAPRLGEICAHGTGRHPYFVAQLVQQMVRRCRELKLKLDAPERQVMLDVAVFLAVQIMNNPHEGQRKVPV